MAKKDELEFEGGVETPQPNNSEKLKALQAAMDKIEKKLWQRFYHENGRQSRPGS